MNVAPEGAPVTVAPEGAPVIAEPGHLTRAESDAIRRRQRARNWAMLAVLVALVALFYAIAMVRIRTG